MEISLMKREADGFTYYKVNLHSHSTISDGHYTPEEMKRRSFYTCAGGRMVPHCSSR